MSVLVFAENWDGKFKKGTFEADDEVGFFFEELKEIGKLLDNLFEEVEDDANSKKEEKEEE